MYSVRNILEGRPILDVLSGKSAHIWLLGGMAERAWAPCSQECVKKGRTYLAPLEGGRGEGLRVPCSLERMKKGRHRAISGPLGFNVRATLVGLGTKRTSKIPRCELLEGL